ncbi:MAG TPA: hypothetical protein VIK84_00195 [Haloplasmataceae bacterium]
MNKLCVLCICTYLFYYIGTNLPIANVNYKSLYQEFLKLEAKYNEKLLRAHNINPQELHEACIIYENYDEKKNCSKSYIIEHTNMSEETYQDVFVHPISYIKEYLNNYETIKDKIFDINELIDMIKKELYSLEFL